MKDIVMTDDIVTRLRIFAIVGLSVLLLTGCGKSEEKRTPTEPTWFKSTSPSGRNVECIWVGDYGGAASNSFQADMECWEIGNG